MRAEAFTPDMILDGNLGMPFLGGLAVTLDLKDGRVSDGDELREALTAPW